MKTRIRRFIDYKSISPIELAELLEVQRSNISHILNGRNKPGAAFLEKFLTTFPEIDARWLLTGEGAMTHAASRAEEKETISGGASSETASGAEGSVHSDGRGPEGSMNHASGNDHSADSLPIDQPSVAPRLSRPSVGYQQEIDYNSLSVNPSLSASRSPQQPETGVSRGGEPSQSVMAGTQHRSEKDDSDRDDQRSHTRPSSGESRSSAASYSPSRENPDSPSAGNRSPVAEQYPPAGSSTSVDREPRYVAGQSPVTEQYTSAAGNRPPQSQETTAEPGATRQTWKEPPDGLWELRSEPEVSYGRKPQQAPSGRKDSGSHIEKVILLHTDGTFTVYDAG